MKKIILFIISVFIFGNIYAQKIERNKIDSVMIKFKKDERSYEQFIAIGKAYCIENLIYNNDISYQLYATLYNSFDPFTRLITKESLDDLLKKYIENNRKIEKIKLNKSSSHTSYFYNYLKTCDKLFSRNGRTRKLYIQLISDEESYMKDYDINKYMKDYLENYFIIIQSD